MPPPINHATMSYASWVNSIEPLPIMQKMLIASSTPNIISFALGLPDPKLFPIEAYQNATQKVLSSTSNVLQYAPPTSNLKQKIVKLMTMRGADCCESQIFLTAGSQQGVSLLARLLLHKGSNIITESFTYPGFLQIVAPCLPKIIGVPLDLANGLCLETLECILQTEINKPAFIYTMPTGHNPLSVSFSEKQKQDLATLSRTYEIPIIEDDPYGFLYYDQQTKPLRAYEDQWVFYVGSFSKIIAPSFRVGWLVVPEALVPKLAFIKEASDINTVTFTQHIIEEMLNSDFFMHEHLKNLRTIYKERRDLMIKAIKKKFPKETKISVPQHGFFIWIELPKNINTVNILNAALEEKIAFMPGQAFSYNPTVITNNCLRLNFSHCEPSLIEIGIEKLGKIITKNISLKIHQNNSNPIKETLLY